MRRLILTLAATLAVAAPLASLDVAWAKEGHGRGNGGGWEQPRGGGDRGGGGEWRGGGRGGGDRGGDDGAWRGPANGNRGGDGGRWRDAPPRDNPQPRDIPSPRRGGYLPPEAGRGAIQDNARYRLRAPPRGYTWVRIGNDFALVSEATGQVFDVVPGR